MKGGIRCVDGRMFRHDPQWDDPDLETDIGECPECEGEGCDRPEARTLFAAARRFVPTDRNLGVLSDYAPINLQCSAGAIRDLIVALRAAERAWPKIEPVAMATDREAD